jgi:hypothetical protein
MALGRYASEKRRMEERAREREREREREIERERRERPYSLCRRYV